MLVHGSLSTKAEQSHKRELESKRLMAAAQNLIEAQNLQFHCDTSIREILCSAENDKKKHTINWR